MKSLENPGTNLNNPSEKDSASEVEKEPFFDNRDRELLLEGADNFIDQAHEQGFDSLVFLDSSARIFAHLILERWKARYPHEQTPEIKFIKVDRKTRTYSQEQKKQYVRQLRESFNTSGWNHGFSFFTGKKVLIVDEFTYSGGTLSFAKEIFEMAFKNKVERIGTGAIWGDQDNSKDVRPTYASRDGISDAVPFRELPNVPIIKTRYEVISHTKRELLPKLMNKIKN